MLLAASVRCSEGMRSHSRIQHISPLHVVMSTIGLLCNDTTYISCCIVHFVSSTSSSGLPRSARGPYPSKCHQRDRGSRSQRSGGYREAAPNRRNCRSHMAIIPSHNKPPGCDTLPSANHSVGGFSRGVGMARLPARGGAQRRQGS